MKNFAGICIGGPLDGKLVESPTPYYYCWIREDIPNPKIIDLDITKQSVRRGVYHHHRPSGAFIFDHSSVPLKAKRVIVECEIVEPVEILQIEYKGEKNS